MKGSFMMMVLAGMLMSSNVSAADKTPQQQKMAMCNQHASSQALKGDVRKQFMSDCLKKDSKVADMSPQQIKMKTCNLQAGDKKLAGDARKTFMSQCLKKS
ncbi:PsiF family protein [Pantoea allii]|uniref:Phosphate starvation-inducible protein n=1 Tax=Pantoea allii TaxID=574096 RepID=A0A2V2BB61_9GAMM|nr:MULTISPECIES: PsiF family protein [Pantoea]MBW1213944.1 phosphate starvation-inducible protein [Pantoea allii]MBW1258217.1 phosphate starvation-inducible protein [Pantoea allii]MBW1267229.1 phosphate starvation-inducible protein [Pantoea allii]MBW1289174.1 phosphate starvation-inducible protein [Pantoea allii]MCH9297031.1 PsiF family protein [Pantoea allii]